MSISDNLDLMKFFALGDTAALFCQCEEIFDRHHKERHLNIKRDVSDADFQRLLHDCVDQTEMTIRKNAKSLAQLIRSKLINWRLNGPMIWFNQFKVYSQTLLRKAKASLSFLLANDINIEQHDKNHICEACQPAVFMIIGEKGRWFDILGDLNKPFWIPELRKLKHFLSLNIKCISFPLLPILLRLQDEKEVTFKIGILREVHNNLRIIWIQSEFSEDIDSINGWRSVGKNGDFVTLKYVFENMMHQLFERKEQNSEIFRDTAKYIVLTVTNQDFSCFQEQNIINNCLHEWLNQNQDETIFIFFALSSRRGPVLGIAEVTKFDDSHLFLKWHKISSHGIKLGNEPKVKEQLNDHCYLIENGIQLLEEYQRKISEPKNLKKVGNVEPPKEVDQHARITLEDIYLDIKAGKKLSIQYFNFISHTSNYDSELIQIVNQNLQIFDKNALNLIFITTERLDRICCLQMLTFMNGYKVEELQNVSIKFCHQIARVTRNKGNIHPCGNGKELLKLYYECLNQRPATLINIGNSCYLASMMQCLKVCFDHDDLDYNTLNNEKTPLSFALFQTLNMMSSTQTSVMASDLRAELGKYSGKFGTDSQQDGFEFLMCLMNNVEKELSEFEADSMSKGISKDVFKGKFAFEIQATWKCKAGHVGNSCQMDYAAHISPHASEPDGADLKNCWKDTFDNEEKEQIFCQECPENEGMFDGELKRTIKNLPEILIIYINRWDFNKFSKNIVNLRFELDDFKVKYSGGSGHYTAVAYCEHIGSLISGHYRAYVSGTKDNVWFMCDDLKDEHEAFIHQENYVRSNNVYTIFYRKKA